MLSIRFGAFCGVSRNGDRPSPDERVGLVRAAVVERRDSREMVEGESAAIDRFLSEFDRLSSPFDMDADRVHVTGSAIIIGESGSIDQRAVILLRHKRLGMWLQPGGHVDGGETPAEAALREAREETGIDLELVDGHLAHVDVHEGGRGHLHLDLRYVLRPVEGADPAPQPPADESQEVFWFSFPDAVERASDERLAALLRSLDR